MSIDKLAAHAWRRMKEKRNCPPIGVLRQGGDLVKRHLQSCTHCRLIDEMKDVFERAGEELANLPFPKADETPIRVGDIRLVNPPFAKSCFYDAEGKYHNPPLVLILGEPDENGFLQVAQVFDEIDLCDQGDVPLGKGLFAEGWNTYGMHRSGLSPKRYYSVTPEIIDSVKEMSALDYPELDGASPLYHFRISEMESGSFFSLGINLPIIEQEQASEYVSKLNPDSDERQLTGSKSNSKARVHQLQTPPLKSILDIVTTDWVEYTPLMAAASECTGKDPFADSAWPVQVKVVINNGNIDEETFILNRTVNFYKLNPGCICEINIPVHNDWDSFEAIAECEGIVSKPIIMDKPNNGQLVIIAEFTSDLPNHEALRFGIRVRRHQE